MTPHHHTTAPAVCRSVTLKTSHDPAQGWTYTAQASIEIAAPIQSRQEVHVTAGPMPDPDTALMDVVRLSDALKVAYVDAQQQPTRLSWMAFPKDTGPDGIGSFCAGLASVLGWTFSGIAG